MTLTGAGGCGKTTLALHAANALLGDHPGGMWWVELAPLTDAAQVPDRIAASVGMSRSLSADSADDILAYLQAIGPRCW